MKTGYDVGNVGSSPTWTPEQYDKAAGSLTSSVESIRATRDMAWLETGGGLAFRWYELRQAEKLGNNFNKLSPEEANAKYPGLETPFREPVNPLVAGIIADRQREVSELAQKIAGGPQDGWQATKNFGAGLLVHMMDPLELGVSSVVGWGVGGAMARTALGRSAIAASETSVVARTGVNLFEAGTGNLIENVAQEIGIKETGEQEGLKYDPIEGMKNVAVSTFFGTALGVGIKEGSFRMARFLKNTSPEADLALVRSQVGEYNAGYRPGSGAVPEALVTETNVSPNDALGKFEYSYSKWTPAEGPRKFYAPSSDGGVTGASVRPIGDIVGEGISMSDNPGVANAAANRSFADSPGYVVEVDSSKVRPLDLNQVLPDDVREDFAAVIKSAVSDSDTALNNNSGFEIMQAIHSAIDDGDLPPTAIKDLQSKLQAKGYNAFLQDGSNQGGIRHSQNNVLTVFDESVLTSVNTRSVDPEVRTDPTPDKLREVVQARQDPRNRLEIDPATFDQALKDLDDDIGTMAPERAEDDADFFDEFKMMEQQGLLEPDLIKEVEAIRDLEADFKFEDIVMKSVIGCVNG